MRGTIRSALYGDALRVLADIQVRGRAACSGARLLTTVSELAREMALMPEWFLGRHLSARVCRMPSRG